MKDEAPVYVKTFHGGKPWPLHPAPVQWVGLTDEDRLELAAAQHGWEDLLAAVEAKLKEKNT